VDHSKKDSCVYKSSSSVEIQIIFDNRKKSEKYEIKLINQMTVNIREIRQFSTFIALCQ